MPGTVQHRGWRVELALAAILLILIAAVLIKACTPYPCEEAIVTRLPSPDGEWEARVDEAICPVPLGGAAIVATARLLSTRDPAHAADLLGVDTGGPQDERPRRVWPAPEILQVTVYDHSYLWVVKRQFGGVRLDLRYDPDDPADRAAWRREHGMSPDPGP